MSGGLLLVSPPLQAGDLPGGVCPSLSNLTLASHLSARGLPVELLDPSVDLPPAPPAELLDRIAAAALARLPGVVGITCMSSTEGRFAVGLARALAARDPAVPVVLGGTWATPWAEEVVRRVPEVAAVVAGAGERAAASLASGGLGRPRDVEGLVWREGDAVRDNPRAEAVPDPVPLDLSLLAHPERYDIFCWQTSRGCPFSCAFCTETLSAPRHTTDPPDKVAADVATLSVFASRWYVWLCDPLFGAGRAHLAEVCERLDGRGLSWLAESRVDVLHADDVPRLARAGCDLVYFGLEAASRRSLVELDKIDDSAARHRRYLEGARAVVEACLREDVLPVVGVVAPVPGDGPGDLREALAFLEELAVLARRLGPACRAPGAAFHAFPLRLDPGAPYEGQEARLRALGVTWSEPADRLFGDRHLARASASVGEEDAAAFREAVRGLTPRAALPRLLRSYPRGYAAFEAGS